MASLNLDIIDALRSRPHTAQELSIKFHLSINTVREMMDRLHRRKVILKDKRNGNVGRGRPPLNYTIAPEYARRMPYIKTSIAGDWTITPTTDILKFYQVETKAIKAAKNLPIIVAKLLVIGQRYAKGYDTLKDQELLNLERSLKRELTLLRKEFEEDIEYVKTTLNLMRQIDKNEDYWNLKGLADHFNTQLTHPDGKTIPPLDIEEALRIIEEEK